MKNENKFYNILEDIFVGSKIEGEGGFVNLLKIKEKYYSKIIEQLKKEIKEDKQITADFKEEFYDKLYSFFEKYFNECGSVYFVKTYSWQKIYERVYSSNNDVCLFWKTNMLYYVKSDLLFKDMVVNIEENGKKYKINFNVKNLNQKQNNIKQNIVYEFENASKKMCEIKVRNSGKNKKTKIDEIASKTGLEEETIEKAIKIFEKQNRVDFFINKNAEQFLTEQLDLFLHQILLEEKNKFEATRLEQLKSFRKYALKLIEFIAQFEDELVRIWNKPKFALDSNYVITADKLNEKNLKLIIKHKNLASQEEEWKELGLIKEKITLETLKKSKLPIDTKYFKDIEIKILSQFENIDEQIDGRLIQSENYQALNTLKNKYNNSINCIYIDPPFNTGEDFAYIDNYQDSTWLSIMKDRIDLAEKLVANDGCFWLHLDYNANIYGKELLKNKYKQITEIIYDTNATKDEESDVFGYKSFGDNFQLKHQTLYYCRNEKYKFNKLWKPNRNTTKLNIGWLDLIAEAKTEKPKKICDYDFGIEKWNHGKLEYQKIDLNDEKIYPIGDIWNDIYSFTQSEMRVSESFSFSSSQKPENLMRRIIQSTTDQRETVLDFFAGSGTTLAVAHKLNRKWIGIEMGEHFNEFYYDGEEKKIGILGRMKLVLSGDKKINCISEKGRHPHLSSDINWNGGGFFKYYKFEQYEDTLSKSEYNDGNIQISVENSGSIFNKYIFFADNKLVNFIKSKNKKIQIEFSKLFENIDFPETLSNLLGMPIMKIEENSVTLNENGKPRKINYDFKKMKEDEKIDFLNLIMPMIWWGK